MSDPYASIARRVDQDPYAGIAKPVGKPKPNKAKDLARAVGQGVSLGFSDEFAGLEAGSRQLGENLRHRITGKPIKRTAAQAYDQTVKSERAEQSRFAQEHPVQNVLAQIAGGLATPGVGAAARFVGGGRNLLASTARSAGVGAGYGAVAGGGSGEGANRLSSAVQGAATGAVIGGALPVVGRAVQTGARAANAAIGQPFGGANRGAVARLREALQQDGLTPQQIEATVQRWVQSGVTPEFLNVVGENTRALIRAAGGTSGPARNAAQQYRNTTVASIPNRAIERTNALTPGETRTPGQFVDDMTNTRSATANQNYGQWRHNPVDVPETVQDMLRDPSGQAIVRRAAADATERQDWAMLAELQALLQPARNGQLPRVSAGTIDALSRAARERGATMAQRGLGARSAGAAGRRAQLDETLDNIPEVQTSRTTYAQQSRAIEAAEGGPSVMGPRSEFQPAIDDLAGNVDAITGARIRERQALRDHFGTRDQVRGRLADIADAPDVRPNLEQLYGAEGGRFADAAGNLVQKQDHANFIAPNTGSQTNSRGGDQRNLLGMVSTAMEIAGGSLRPLLERAARGLTMTEQERKVLIQLGIGSPQDALAALSAPPPAASQITGNAFRRIGVTLPSLSQQRGSE